MSRVYHFITMILLHIYPKSKRIIVIWLPLQILMKPLHNINHTICKNIGFFISSWIPY